MNSLLKSLKKIVDALEEEKITYMIVGGFAVAFYNRARMTNDIDICLQIYPEQIDKVIKHFPDWVQFVQQFKQQARTGMVFNIIDFDTGIKYDFMLYQDNDYNWTAFERRKFVDFLGVNCAVSSAEDLIISKLNWYNISKSEKQWADLQYLMTIPDLNLRYLEIWTTKLFINRHGLF